ncbi:phosphoglycerate dehydrogenase-like enzyme [Bradyrhizobium diazoefficiens]
MRGVFVDANEALAVIMERLEKPGDPKVRINRDPDIKPEQYPEILDGAEIAIVDHTALPTDVAKKCTGLKHVVFLGTGARSYMNPEELAELGISVHLIKGYGDTAVAESAIALMWASARVIAMMDREMRVGNWLREDGMQLTGKTLGLIGFGGIAAEVARIASGSGMKVIAWNRSPKSSPGVTFTDLDTVLATSDVVSLHLLLNEENARHDHAREDLCDEARRHPHQHRARRSRRRGRHDRRAEVGPHPSRRPRRLQRRAPARGSSADKTAERDTVGAFGVPHAGGQREPD